MRRFIVSVASTLLLVSAPSIAQAQATKTINGTITAIAADSVTVNADGKDMKFAIDADTQVVAPGGGTKSRTAKAEGKGVSVADILKTGQAVEVRYHEQGMRAARIRAIASVPSPAGPKAQSASGVITAISGNSLTIKGSAGDVTFSVDEKTTVSGEGVGTAGRKITSEGQKPNLADFLKEGDAVSVTYHDMEGTKHASVIRITRRKS